MIHEPIINKILGDDDYEYFIGCICGWNQKNIEAGNFMNHLYYQQDFSRTDKPIIMTTSLGTWTRPF